VSLAWIAYRALAPCLGAVLPATRIFISPRERGLWRERLGHTSLPAAADAWVHAASLGEATAVAPLLREMTTSQPAARLLLTATTLGGRERLARLGAPAAIAPLDSPQATRHFFAGVRPRRLFLIETELWPHWLLAARARDVPVAVVSARLSERSLARYRRLGTPFRALVSGLAAVLCQTTEDLERWRLLGARDEASEVTGNLKDDSLPAPAADRPAARAGLGMEADRPLLVLGSVRPGEVTRLARAWKRLPAELRGAWQVAVVPRHPRASAELRAEATRAGQHVAPPGGRDAGAWTWDDRLGVLNRWYAAADVAFVGGSLAPYGGHNPLEPASCGAAVVMGRHHATQRDAVRALAARDAVRLVADEQDLVEALGTLLADPAARERAARDARAVVDARRGTAGRTLARLAERGLWPAA